MRRLPTQYAAVPATTSPPMPVACTSRSRPPVPVSAPGNGATPEGKLCVSAVKMMSCVRFASRKGDGFPGTSGMIVVMPYPLMELELSLKAMTLLFRFASQVAFTIFISVSRHFFAIHDEPAAEEPVARMFAVRLGKIEAFHVGRIALDVVHEKIGVIVQVPVIETQAHLAVDLLERRPSLFLERDDATGSGFTPVSKVVSGFG